jgi:membrane peptidoglycan carboxypeptidase
VSLLEATADSINTAYAELNLDMGPEHTREAAETLGIPEDTPGLSDDSSNVLGTASPTVLQQAEAYGTLAAKGVRHPSHMVSKVKNPDGTTRFEADTDGERVIDEKVAINATVALQGPPSTGSASSLVDVMDGRPVAGKTGTSESFKSAWFVGYTPQMVTAVGMFQPSEDGSAEEALTAFGGVTNMTGGKWPTTIWGEIMSKALDGEEVLYFDDAVQLDNQQSGNEGSNQSPVPTTTQPPATTEEPTTEEPTETQTEEPTETETETAEPTETEEPTETDSEEPTESDSEQPTESESTADDGGGGDNGDDDSNDDDEDGGAGRRGDDGGGGAGNGNDEGGAGGGG